MSSVLASTIQFTVILEEQSLRIFISLNTICFIVPEKNKHSIHVRSGQ